MKSIHLAVILLVLVVLLGAFFAYGPGLGKKGSAEITSFSECVEAGNPVMESYPRQCRADGETFVEDIENEIEKRDLIRLDSPRPNDVVSSPLKVSGEARGTWFFEATFSMRIVDEEGNLLGEHYVQAQDEWMTEEFVPFEGTLSFDSPQTKTGVLFLDKANPSGLPEHEDTLRVPVRFDQGETQTRTVTLYYYDSSKDVDESGNILCSEKGLVPVERNMLVSQTPIQDTLRRLIEGDLTRSERQAGIDTEFPLSGFELVGASRSDGTLTLEFSDPENRTSGGSCRAGILWAQIKKTALQFDGVDDVIFIPETLFQP